ncbi:UDP-glucosyltransferase 2-like [Leptidea sinapis]|uniref:UDP-glucosyltransferase 2-like n=1 Tax=Leptidea sinapis TaxID=189913 RepID=UPI002121722B|nr:UDP-glucosyltransferase 2-like [Leptidea sinapis]
MNMIMKKLLLLFLTLSTAAAYNILCIHNVPSKSHFQLLKGIVKPLLEAGHQVTFVTTYPHEIQHNNLTVIDASSLMKIVDGIDAMEGQRFKINVGMFAKNISTQTADNPKVKEIIVKNNYDAIVTEWFFSELESGYAAVQQVPWIMLCGTVKHSHLEYLTDTVRSVSTVPDLLNYLPMPLSFWQRIVNNFIYVMKTLDFWKSFPTIKSDYQTYFEPLAKARGIPLPPFEDAHRNISIMFVNSHPSFDPVRVMPPNVIDIAGYHIEDKTPELPQDLQTIMDSSPQGVIYFSMGSVLKSSMLTEENKRGLIQMFSELPYTVLWKFEAKLEGLPKNVHIRSWMPQTSILAHPNTKVFITHGGLLSTLEALKYGVPMLAIPVFGDQPGNAQRSVMSGLALKLDFSHDLGPGMKIALKELLTNDSYYNTAKSTSAVFNMRPVHTSTLITHYIELAIETKGAFHLRSKTNLYAWWEHMMLDQLVFILAVLYLLKYTAHKIISLINNKTSHTKKNQ